MLRLSWVADRPDNRCRVRREAFRCGAIAGPQGRGAARRHPRPGAGLPWFPLMGRPADEVAVRSGRLPRAWSRRPSRVIRGSLGRHGWCSHRPWGVDPRQAVQGATSGSGGAGEGLPVLLASAPVAFGVTCTRVYWQCGACRHRRQPMATAWRRRAPPGPARHGVPWAACDRGREQGARGVGCRAPPQPTGWQARAAVVGQAARGRGCSGGLAGAGCRRSRRVTPAVALPRGERPRRAVDAPRSTCDAVPATHSQPLRVPRGAAAARHRRLPEASGAPGLRHPFPCSCGRQAWIRPR